MNTSALKRFAQQARNILKSGVEKKLISWGYNPKTKQFSIEPQQVFGGMLFGEKMIDDPTVYPKWMALKKAIQTKGVTVVVEEAAYTWFNRLIAIQILAKNNYIAPQLEYASVTTRTPIIVQNAKRGNNPTMDTVQHKILNRLLDDDRLETELFALLITAYCHHSDLLQRVFGKLDDYTELLLPSDILATNGFINLINTTDAITDDDYRQVELIGWLYQFYISEKKDEVFKSFKNKKKAEAEDIPAATQIFTPNWIVKYMVQNTVGRLWLDLNPDSRLRSEMKYLVENSESEANYQLSTVNCQLIKEVAHLKLLDPASGSGHILVEGFDLLYAMYREEGYTASEAVRSIFENNLFGLDIDPRAAQLATFALLLKAAAHDRSILASNLLPHVYAMPEKEIFTRQEVLDFLGEANATHADALYNALELMQQSQNLGSIMKFNFTDQALAAIIAQTSAWKALTPTDILQQDLRKRLAPYMQVLQVLTQRYEAVAANPPYMGGGNMNDKLKEYVNSKYPNSKSDLFSVFMEVCMDFCQPTARMGMINMHSWMFLSSFEALRKFIIETYHIENMLHLGPRTFDELSGEVVQNAAFVLQNSTPNQAGTYYRLVEGGNSTEKHQMFLNSENRFSNISQANFEKIPGSPIAYWVSSTISNIYTDVNLIDNLSKVRQGLATCNNNLFTRFWYEVGHNKIGIGLSNKEVILSSKKWFPYNKGGGFRKWYGNNSVLVNWEKNGFDIHKYNNLPLEYRGAPVRAKEFYFRPGLTYGLISSFGFSARRVEKGFIFDVGGSMIFSNNSLNELLIISVLCSKISKLFLDIINPTLNYQVGDVKLIPIKSVGNEVQNDINLIALSCIELSKIDWDSRETSWDFEKHPLIKAEQSSLQAAYQAWEAQVTQDFYSLHANETELNRIFIDIYGLQDELTPEVKLKDITILQEELDSKVLGDVTEPIGKLPIKQDVVMRQLISYLVGCLMGRYRLDKSGLHIAHPAPTAEEKAPYLVYGGWCAVDSGRQIVDGNNIKSKEYGNSNEFQGFESVAASHGVSEKNLYCNEANAQGGDVLAHQSDKTGSSKCAEQYSGRSVEGNQGISTLSENSIGFAGGNADTINTNPRTGNDSGSSNQPIGGTNRELDATAACAQQQTGVAEMVDSGQWTVNGASPSTAHQQPSTIFIDDDGIIPLMDSTCSFGDNALIRIKHLLEVQWGGDKQLIETINYLQAALGKELETYLVRDFWKDHCARYQKRPIYWLFASPKGAFQVITYMHRMNKYTVEKIRSNYLLVHIRNLENQYSTLKANELLLTRDDSKRMERIKADLLECRDYDLLLKDMADRQIDFDLDDGVVVNYAKFDGVVALIK
jgi:type II restriction/modification system DNA methylase subunit YeeA